MPSAQRITLVWYRGSSAWSQLILGLPFPDLVRRRVDCDAYEILDCAVPPWEDIMGEWAPIEQIGTFARHGIFARRCCASSLVFAQRQAQLRTFPTLATGFAAVMKRTDGDELTDPAALNPWHVRDGKTKRHGACRSQRSTLPSKASAVTRPLTMLVTTCCARFARTKRSPNSPSGNNFGERPCPISRRLWQVVICTPP